MKQKLLPNLLRYDKWQKENKRLNEQYLLDTSFNIFESFDEKVLDPRFFCVLPGWRNKKNVNPSPTVQLFVKGHKEVLSLPPLSKLIKSLHDNVGKSQLFNIALRR